MIKVLDKSVSELIAAGEVIEKPASVVKELIENSIDAGATAITVEIKNGGISFLRITDNGCGIPARECPTAFLRHATSKVTTGEDLNAISTLGFRGEALASVAAVSRVHMLTKTSDCEWGTSYKIEGGVETEHEKAGCPDGTTIIIKDLFFNTPARLKFLKKDVSEGNAIGAVVDKAALINPHIAFRFIRNNSLVRVTPGDGKLYSAVFAVYGKNLAANMIAADCSQAGISVSGFVSRPLFCKNNRSFQNFYVNTRCIKSPTCSAALEEAYRNNIMTGKFPACVLNITMNPSDVDANVHPAKTEVRFSNDRAVFSAVHIAVKNALLNADADVSDFSDFSDFSGETDKSDEFDKSDAIAETAENSPTATPIIPEQTATFNSVKTDYTVVKSPIKLTAAETAPVTVQYKYINSESFIRKEKSNPINQAVLIEKEESENYRVIGELFSTYILCESGEKDGEKGGELLLIDKHAADERLRFNELKARLRIHSQLLIEPKKIRLDSESVGILLEAADELEQIGVRIKPNENSDNISDGVVVTAMPTILEGISAEELLSTIADVLKSGGEVTASTLDPIDEIMHRIACRAAIKAGDKSVPYDMEQLAKAVLEGGLRYCPHGRPVTVRITKRELEKKFKRII